MKEKLSTLWAYISNQQFSITEIFQKIVHLKPVNEDKMVNLAYQLHNLYSAYEDIFKEISVTFENNIDRSIGYHKNLLLRMKLTIPDIRPNVLSDESYQVLGELMAFRHVFRHACNYTLSPDKMKLLKNRIIEGHAPIEKDISIFKSFLQEVIAK